MSGTTSIVGQLRLWTRCLRSCRSHACTAGTAGTGGSTIVPADFLVLLWDHHHHQMMMMMILDPQDFLVKVWTIMSCALSPYHLTRLLPLSVSFLWWFTEVWGHRACQTFSVLHSPILRWGHRHTTSCPHTPSASILSADPCHALHHTWHLCCGAVATWFLCLYQAGV